MVTSLAWVRAALVCNHLGGPTILCYPQFMAKSIRVNTKRRGRPKTTGKGELIGVRILPPLLKELDAWIAGQVPHPSRPEAIRGILERALPAPSEHGAGRTREAQKASERADRAAHRAVDKSYRQKSSSAASAH